MERFIARYPSLVTWLLCDFDRIVFRGSPLPLIRPGGMFLFLQAADARLLDFKPFVLAITERLKEASLAEARRLPSATCPLPPSTRRARPETCRCPPVERGLICVFSVLEPRMTFEYHRFANRAGAGLRLVPRKCL